MSRITMEVARYRPDLVVVVGDVNSTLACGLVAAKMGILVAHVEAGLRSFDRRMPEEINRILTDSLSDLLFVSEPSGVDNLRREALSFIEGARTEATQAEMADRYPLYFAKYVHKGAEQLYAAYRASGLSLEGLESRYQRISHIKALLREGVLDDDLRFRDRATPQREAAIAAVA